MDSQGNAMVCDSTQTDSLHVASEGIERLPRCEDLWFEDGNLVVAAPDLTFRLHRGILARHSDIFKDMFQLLSQSEQNTAVHGCPVVQLHHDRGSDLVMLFTLLYDGIKE